MTELTDGPILGSNTGAFQMEEPCAADRSFQGLSIYMYFDDHPPPHFHVRAGSTEAVVVIRSGRLQGTLSARNRVAVDRWRRLHMLELLQNWSRAERHEPLHSIEPLR